MKQNMKAHRDSTDGDRGKADGKTKRKEDGRAFQRKAQEDQGAFKGDERQYTVSHMYISAAVHILLS